MKLAYISDLHIDAGPLGKTAARLLPEVVKSAQPDVFIIGGDIAAKHSIIDHTLASFHDLTCRKLFVPGNHDIWVSSAKEREDGITSRDKYRVMLPGICKDNGFHYLPGCPLVIDRIGFAGTIGWYDYSMRNKDFDNVIPEQVYRRKHYLGKVWNDRRYAKWGASDVEVAQEMTVEIDRDLSIIDPDVERIVSVIHHLPFTELIRRTGEISWDYFNAFMGSDRLGKTLLKHPKLFLVLSGHTHFRMDKTIDGIRTITSPLGYARERADEHEAVVRESLLVLDL